VGYMSPDAIEAAMNQLVIQYGDLCSAVDLGQTAGGRRLTALQIQGSSPQYTVVVIGGVHAREWAPPDALVSFAKRILQTQQSGNDIVYPTIVINGVPYSSPPYTITANQVSAILDEFRLLIFPLVNPDGRQFSMRGTSGRPTPTEQLWRKNRHAFPGGIGVDLNRNFDIAWDHTTYYNPAAAALAAVAVDPAKDPYQQYKGPQAFSEPETQAVRDLVSNNNPLVFVDVHMWGRQIQYPWGMERAQSDDSDENFSNTDYDHDPADPNSGRDGLLGDDYSEYLDDDAANTAQGLATAMANEIASSAGTASLTANQRSLYAVGQVVTLSSPLPYQTYVGCSDDWVYSQQFTVENFGSVYAFTIEAGIGPTVANDADDDGGFFPVYATQYPKVEREIHAGLFGLLINGGL
jgi:murein tripeptide amidase MpaA